PRFGRCAYFIICDTDDMSFEAFNNENITLGGGAGIQSAQFIASKGAEAVITGNCGPNAVNTLAAADVQLFVGQSGTVKEGMERFKSNELKPAQEANVSDHFGMQRGDTQSQSQVGGVGTAQPSGRGMGLGRGRGMGRGRGLGRGMGRGKA
ncbi:NifB/NifX family molybdenum-iron cluster-binding protein, partial [Thermodesulfobacteriota bacterium]